MKRGKDEEKILEPMFPRLHVNDADKGGPRAPPRNKMALYEQLSIPSQRFSDHGSLALNSRSNTSTLVSPGPSSQPCGVESNLSAQHQVSSSASGHATEKLGSQRSFMENVTSLALHAQRKRAREENDFAVPVFNSRRFQSHGRTKNGIEKGKHTPSVAPCSRHSGQFQEVNLEGSKHEVRDQVKRNAKLGGFVNSLDLSVTEEMDVEKSASTSDRVNDCGASSRQEFRNRLDRDDGEASVKDTHNGIESNFAPESHSEQGDGSPDDVDNGRGYCRSRECASPQQKNEEASDGVSDNSIVDSIYSIDVSPDDVVGVLGQKRFWRARKAIATVSMEYRLHDSGFLVFLLLCQQRVFAVQLFELHILIKVQKLIAASPHLLLEDLNYLGKVSAKRYPVKKLVPSEYMVKPPLPQVIKHKSDDSEKTEQHKMECSAENIVGRLPNHGHHQQPSNYMPAPPAVNGCCFPPQPSPSGNQQWLIPVMSPSEGLIYKPHPGMGQTGPVCGGYYGHYMPTPMVMGGPPPFHPGVGFPFPSPGNPYFPPYGMMPTMMNPYCPSQQEQQQPNQQNMNQFGHNGSALNTQQSSVNETQQPPEESYPRARMSRQGSTGSSPNGAEGISGNNFFRPFSARDGDDNINDAPPKQMMTTTLDGGVTRVIKVVPHNAKLASENAARIFRSIQEERKHYDSFT